MSRSTTSSPKSAPDAAARSIVVRGARENNLENVDIDVPLDVITVFTGVSGSGNSSLVFDTIAAESQRQLNETFPAFVRNRLPQLGTPDVDALRHLSASVVIDQQPFGGNARSTVGTATDLAPALRLLWSRIGTPTVGYSNVFSFNQPAGMCPRCEGLGTVDDLDEDALLDRSRSLNDGAIRFPTFEPGTWLDVLSPLRRAFADANDVAPGWFSSGSDGACPVCRGNGTITTELAFMDDVETPCDACGGNGYNDTALSYRLDGLNIAEALALPSRDAVGRFADVVAAVADAAARMVRCGIGYLSLGRRTDSLSGGERQRLKLARELAQPVAAYAFDEPTTGLHGRDIASLLALFDELIDDGASLLVIEHDLDVMAHADWIVDIGPGAGSAGGRVIHSGTPADLVAHGDSPTAQHLRRWTAH